MFAIGLFFAILSHKAFTVKNPDSRRRLKLMAFGTTLAMTPLFLLILYRNYQTRQRIIFRYVPGMDCDSHAFVDDFVSADDGLCDRRAKSDECQRRRAAGFAIRAGEKRRFGFADSFERRGIGLTAFSLASDMTGSVSAENYDYRARRDERVL